MPYSLKEQAERKKEEYSEPPPDDDSEDGDEKGNDNCKHSWVPAGRKQNKDRIHNKGNGQGKYMAYKCEKCKKFKRRYLK